MLLTNRTYLIFLYLVYSVVSSVVVTGGAALALARPTRPTTPAPQPSERTPQIILTLDADDSTIGVVVGCVLATLACWMAVRIYAIREHKALLMAHPRLLNDSGAALINPM